MVKQPFNLSKEHFQVTFPNGVMVSLFNGRDAYCSGHSESEFTEGMNSETVEVAVIDTNGKDEDYWLTSKIPDDLLGGEGAGDNVYGYFRAKYLPGVMAWAMNLPTSAK